MFKHFFSLQNVFLLKSKQKQNEICSDRRGEKKLADSTRAGFDLTHGRWTSGRLLRRPVCHRRIPGSWRSWRRKRVAGTGLCSGYKPWVERWNGGNAPGPCSGTGAKAIEKVSLGCIQTHSWGREARLYFKMSFFYLFIFSLKQKNKHRNVKSFKFVFSFYITSPLILSLEIKLRNTNSENLFKKISIWYSK